jgi:hypothetical protein
MEKPLTDHAGVWIDHRKAVIVALEPNGERIHVIVSNVEKHLERGGDSPLKGEYEAAQVPPDDKRQRALTAELNGYYDAVTAALRDTGSVILFGPGEAKGELHKRMLKMNAKVQVLAVETEDKMTDPQIAAKVRGYFGVDAPRGRQAE